MRKKIAADVQRLFDEQLATFSPSPNMVRRNVERLLAERAAQLREQGYGSGVAMRTCVTKRDGRPDKLIVQIHGPDAVLERIGFKQYWSEDTTDEQMCDDWSDWEEV